MGTYGNYFKFFKVKLPILQVNFFTCAVSIDLGAIYKIFVAAGGTIIMFIIGISKTCKPCIKNFLSGTVEISHV